MNRLCFSCLFRRFSSFVVASVCVIFSVAVFGCRKYEELTLSEIEERTRLGDTALVSKTVSKPWKGEEFKPGKTGGVWYDTILNDPKTFNQLIGERDSASSGIISLTLDYLVDYDEVKREWIPHCADFSIETDEKNQTLTVHYTLRDDIFWSWYGKDEKIPVTSDDFVFWYNEIAGDEEFSSSGYGSQFVTTEDGEEKRVECVKIDDKHFDFVFPCIFSEPLLHTNMSPCPSFIYKKAKKEGGHQGVKNLFSIASDVRSIPSCGKWYITGYETGRRLICKKNPYYWERDSEGNNIPYCEDAIFSIVGDSNTEYLLFRQGKIELYYSRPEELSDLVDSQGDEFTVFNAEGALSSSFWSFNQNPKNKDEAYYSWFTNKKFRQAMSCLLNRERIINQTYRGLAEPHYMFFPEVNPFYNPEITLSFRYDRERALRLLNEAGFTLKENGTLYDPVGRAVEFDLSVNSSATVLSDIALILRDELGKVGINLNIRQVDFQKLVEMLTSTYDWQSVFIGFGAMSFPSQGSNVWPSSGNLHVWYPLQKEPATSWEARVDYLYNKGLYTIDKKEATQIWDEYQRIILDECPLIYLVRPKSFVAVRNKWDFSNFYYDNKVGALTNWIFLRDM